MTQAEGDIFELPETIIEEAQRLVYGNRERDYGHPRENFELIAKLWTEYLAAIGNPTISAADAAQMLLLMKVARFATGGVKRDTIVDQAGYAAVTARVLGMDE